MAQAHSRPAARYSYALTYDERDKKVILFGGFAGHLGQLELLRQLVNKETNA